MAKSKPKKSVETITHDEASRKNIPTAEYQSVMRDDEQSPVRVAYDRRNRDLDPQLVWRGKDEQDWSDLVVHAPPLYIQEKVHPKVLIDDLIKQSEKQDSEGKHQQMDLFADFNGLPDEKFRTEFYQHEANWTNRMILGDSLQVMASLAEREGLRGQVQCIYIDPPYGIKFNSNFQWSTTSTRVTDGKVTHITREPEQVKAFRDTWRDGNHSYLTYLRDRFTVARDLLSESGSIFVQIGDENVHTVRSVLDEVFGFENHCATIQCQKTTGAGSPSVRTVVLASVIDYVIWYAKNNKSVKYRQLFTEKKLGEKGTTQYVNLRDLEQESDKRLKKNELLTFSANSSNQKIFAADNLTSQSPSSTTSYRFLYNGKKFKPGKGYWKTTETGLNRLSYANRLKPIGNSLMYRRFFDDFPVSPLNNLWQDVFFTGFTDVKLFVVQTSSEIIKRCILMTTDPGDLVVDPTCGSGTTAYVSEGWGRRWITIDTSRVALALARARIMGARYPYYLLSDSREGQSKEAEIFQKEPSRKTTHGDVRQGFVYERVPHITLKSIANNAEIDVIWETFQELLLPLQKKLNESLGKKWEEYEIPRKIDNNWPEKVKIIHEEWWRQRFARQKKIDTSIAAKAEFEYLCEKPCTDKRKVRVAGPFTVESISPHRVLDVDENDEFIDHVGEKDSGYGEKQNFAQMILENLKTAGVQQAHKEDKIIFTSLVPWPGQYICGEGSYQESDEVKRAAIFIGPEFGTVSRPDLVAAAREAGDAGFDVLISCAFNYDAHSTEFNSLGRIPVLKARMNADLHMADDLKNTGKGNLFVIFGEPDVDVLNVENGQMQVKIKGVDVFHPQTGEVRSDGPEGIACWFLDTDYNEESFFVRHAYFLGANDPYKALKTTLKSEIDRDAWESLHSDTSRPFEKPASGRIAVKVINHLGDEVMKVFKVD
jgi:adenine-specific DNA-methyltransferase